MSDDPKKPDPIEDLRNGLGLLFRAAKTAVDQIPTDKIEQAVKDGAREVTKALETVGDTIDEKVLGHKKQKPPSQGASAPSPSASSPSASSPSASSPSASSASINQAPEPPPGAPPAAPPDNEPPKN